jgi:hypothetical protein
MIRFLSWKPSMRGSSKMQNKAQPKLLRKRAFAGFTILELTVASGVALTILSLSMGMLNEQRRQILGDRTRAGVNDNLRIASDMVGADIKQAGERLESDSELPGVSIINGSGTTPDRLVLQRKLLTERVPVCQNIAVGTGNRTLDVSVVVPDPNPTLLSSVTNCPYSYSSPKDSAGNDIAEPSASLRAVKPTDNLRSLRQYRCEQDATAAANTDPCARTTVATTDCQQLGGTDRECTWAYIHDPVNNRGEFFLYSFEDQGTCKITATPYSGRNCQRITRADTLPWRFAYRAVDQPQIYILEEREYRLTIDTSTTRTDDYVLELRVNQERRMNGSLEEEVWKRIVNQIAGFQVQGRVAGALVNTFNPDRFFVTDWKNLQAIQITFNSINPNPDQWKIAADEQGKLSLTSQFLPRNVASRAP